VHDPEFTFEMYGVLRKQKLSEKDIDILDRIEYHVYDIIDPNLSYIERLEKIKSLPKIEGLCIVETVQCNSKDELKSMHQTHIRAGYEGTMIRNKTGKYICKYRSFDLLKYKDFDDNEFKIVGFTFEKDTSGEDSNLIVWVCETKTGQRFNVQSKGTKEERKALYNEAENYIGKNLWVQHFGLTADGIPRFPKTARAGKESIRMEVY
jgi:ATP-dependent DNA ligase